ncbi:hypothetical protein HDU87_000252 [Geranomyces variabilis]|uniref:Uncharacterized protein n=1 Tax=Geranomyces variabilis TaxID=109894 RepID=A0AAD5TS95_9FUNG|nr:hypothetical protein HDU87_000252 [Geranomyces variabilis]
MERYCESLGAPSIPRDLLAECLDETLEVERELEDPFLGNCLDVGDGLQGVDGPTMVFSRGAAFGDVCVAEFATGCGNAVARFRNPVLQVLTGGSASNGKRLLVVRNHASASILAFGRKQDYAGNQCDATWESQTVDILPFEHRPLDVAINPTLSAEVAVLLDGGDISVWNGERETRCYPIAKYDQPPAPYAMKRKSCQYGAHPRTLVVAHVDRVDTVDFRSPSIRPATVFESRSELVRAFRRDPRDALRVVLATTSRTALIDTRFHGRTLLEWDYQNNREAPYGIQFLPPVDNDSESFVAWARVSGEIQAYAYGSPAAQMPQRVAKPGNDVDGAPALPTIHELISPSWTAAPVSLARPTQLDPCRRSPQHPSVPRQRRYQKGLHNQHIEKEEDPGWPPLRGLALSSEGGSNSGKAVLMQLADDGAIYTQPILYGESAEADSLRSHVEAESGALDSAAYDDPEQAAIKQYKAHRRKDWRPLATFLRFAALKVDRVPDDHVSPSDSLDLAEFLKPDDESRCTTFHELAIRANRPPPPVSSALPGASFWAPGIFSLPNNLPASEESHNVLPLTMRGFLSRTHSSLDEAHATVRAFLGREESHDDNDEEMALRHIAHDVRLASVVSTPPSQRQLIPDNDPSQPHSFTAGSLESQYSQFSQFSQYSHLSQQTDFSQSAALDLSTATGGGDHHPRHQSTLYTPYASAPIRLSATATEFRKRWTNPEDYYGPVAIYHEGPVRNGNQQKRRRANDRKRSRTLSSVGRPSVTAQQTPARVTPASLSLSSASSLLAVPTPVVPAVVVAASQVSAAAASPMLAMSVSMDVAGSPARAPATQGSARKKPARKKGF